MNKGSILLSHRIPSFQNPLEGIELLTIFVIERR